MEVSATLAIYHERWTIWWSTTTPGVHSIKSPGRDRPRRKALYSGSGLSPWAVESDVIVPPPPLGPQTAESLSYIDRRPRGDSAHLLYINGIILYASHI